MSAQVRQEGIWEIRTWDAHDGVEAKRLLRCPLCNYQFNHNENRADHFASEHGPEDVGLTPLSADYDGQSSISSFGGDVE